MQLIVSRSVFVFSRLLLLTQSSSFDDLQFSSGTDSTDARLCGPTHRHSKPPLLPVKEGGIGIGIELELELELESAHLQLFFPRDGGMYTMPRLSLKGLRYFNTRQLISIGKVQKLVFSPLDF